MNGSLIAQHVSLQEAEHAYNQGREYYLAEHSDSAAIFFLQAINLYKKAGRESDTLIADCYHNLGLALFSQKQYEKALLWVRKGMAIRKALLKPDHPGVGLSYKSLGDIYLDVGKYDSTLFYYELSRPIVEKDTGITNSKAILYSNMGSLYQDKGDYEKAEENHLKGLDIRLKLFDEESYEVSASYNNLGNTYLDMGRHELAMDYYIKALSIKEKVLDEEHPSLASSYNNLGSAYQLLGEDQKALKNYEKALEIRRRIFPENHPYLGRSYYNIGSIYLNLDEFEKPSRCLSNPFRFGWKASALTIYILRWDIMAWECL